MIIMMNADFETSGLRMCFRKLGRRMAQGIAALRKCDMAAAVASHLVKVDPQTAGWWISLAYAVRRAESVEKAEAILLQAQTIHPKVAMIAFNLACYASITGRFEEAKARLKHAIELIGIFEGSLSMSTTCDLCGTGLLTWRRVSFAHLRRSLSGCKSSKRRQAVCDAF
jgi:tetratricopeptide (TPR) repeat protein